MSGQNQGSTTVTFDEGDTEEPLYNYGRPFQKGGQQGFLLRVTMKAWPDGGKQLDIVVGTGCPTMPGKGVKSDYRIRIPSPEYGEFLRMMGVTPVMGQAINLEQFKNQEVWATLGEEVDRAKSEAQGTKVMRAKCLTIGPKRAPAAPPPVASSQPKPPAFA